MPRYDFKCSDCQRSTERHLMPGKPRPEALTCQLCGGVATRQFPTRTTFRLGPDRYEADYRRDEMTSQSGTA